VNARSMSAWLCFAAMLLTPAVVLAAETAGGDAKPAQATTSSCIACHSDSEMFEAADLEIVKGFANDVHAKAGLGCQDCHGGNASPEVADDMAAAMDEDYAKKPFRGTVERRDIPALCGSCHSDPEFMRRYRPELRIDQEREYWTSQHGKALAAGRTNVATCIDCHSVHGILSPEDPQSPVYPTRVAETCRKCHSDQKHMAGVKLPDGRLLPTDQYARWRRSVHAAALLDRGDLTAPTCNDCHGNHGAAPPGLNSIGFVCGQCHGREAALFRASRKHEGFATHNELMADAGEEGCAGCHSAPEPQAEVKDVHSFSECTTCHSNHSIVRPTLAMLGPLPEAPCAFCHEGQGPLAAELPELPKKERHYKEVKAALVADAVSRGLAGDALFDDLVDKALNLSTHTFPASAEGGKPVLRPEFQRLFAKFRIGKTYYTYTDPDSGKSHRVDVVRCSHCHAPAVKGENDEGGMATSAHILDRMHELTSVTARAERTLLAAHRGGIEARGALDDISTAVDAQISLEVLLHGFDAGPSSKFVAKQTEGLKSAGDALRAGHKALAELAYRYRGLGVSLVIIVLFAIALALKIRQLSSRSDGDAS